MNSQQVYIIKKSEVPELSLTAKKTFFKGESISKSKIKEICQNSLKQSCLSSLYEIKLVASLALRRKGELISEQIELKIDSDGRSKNNCFFFKTINGNWQDFSFIKALRLEQSVPHKQDIQEAFRYSILEQIREFRNKTPSVIDLIKDEPNIHIDHEIPFSKILKDFCQEDNLNLKDVEIKCVGVSERKIVNAEIEANWQDHHKKHAKLRAITAHENLTRPRKG